MIFHDTTTKFFFVSKHQNKAEIKNLYDFEVLSSDFPGLKTSAISMASTASTTSMASMTFTAPDGWILPGNQMTNTGPFLGHGLSQTQIFTDICTFSIGGC